MLEAQNGSKNPPEHLPDEKAKKVQLDFFEKLIPAFDIIEAAIKSRELALMPKEKVLSYAESLIEKGNALKAAVSGK